MIFDNILFAEKYYSIHKHFEAAFEFLSQDLSKLKNDRYNIVGTNEVYATISENTLREKNNAPLESHKRYIDIQFLIRGDEKFGVSAINYCRIVRKQYNSDNDIAFWDDTPMSYVNLIPNDFVIFFPNDAHAPLIGDGNVRKVVIKIEVTD